MIIPYPLDSFAGRVFSQFGEDGIINALVHAVQPPKYFVEFGCHPKECNCLVLDTFGWNGLFMDAHHDTPLIHKEWVTASNINGLLDAYKVPQEVGVLSIDIDGEDIWVWQAIERQPWIVVIEYNGHLPMDQAVAWPHRDDFKITGLNYGASLKALDAVGRKKGYALVYSNGVNAFFVRRDLFSNAGDFVYDAVCRPWPDPPTIIGDPIKAGFEPVEG